jgi:transposase
MGRQTITSHGQTTVGNVVGIDPHKHTLSAAVLDGCGGLKGLRHFKVSGAGHRALEAWAQTFGPVQRWGVEGAGACGRHTAIFLAERGHDVREVCPNRTRVRGRGRGRGKSDALDAELIARETLAHPELPAAFKRAGGDRGPDKVYELMALWHRARRMRVKQARLLTGEAESILVALPRRYAASYRPRSRCPHG